MDQGEGEGQAEGRSQGLGMEPEPDPRGTSGIPDDDIQNGVDPEGPVQEAELPGAECGTRAGDSSGKIHHRKG